MQIPAVSLVALLDEGTGQFIQSLRQWLSTQGIPLDHTALPPHLFLAGYGAPAAPEVCGLASDAAARTRNFAFSYSHVGIAPDGGTLFLAPEVNRPLLSLRERFVHSQNWMLYTPLLSVDPTLLGQVVPYVVPNVQPFEARVTGLAVIREDGAVLFQKKF